MTKPRDRLGEVIGEYIRERAAQQQASEAHRANEAERDAFKAAWHYAYPQSSEFDAEFFRVASRRLIALGSEITRHFWDYRIAQWRAATPCIAVAYESCAIILRRACSGDLRWTSDALKQCEPFLQGVYQAHFDLFDILDLESRRHGLPLTPPVSQARLAALAGLKYRTFLSQKEKRWVAHPDDDIPNKRDRRWQHREDAQHAELLRRIQQKNPGIIWGPIDHPQAKLDDSLK